MKILNKIFIKTMQNEEAYIELVRDILENGSWEDGRNGKTKEVFGRMLRFDLSNGKFPLLTTKKMSYKTVLRELLWFIRGKIHNKYLNEVNVHIWDGNSNREFLDSVGLSHYPEGFLGPIYSHQWRNFNGNYDICDHKEYCTCNDIYKSRDTRIDQLQQIIDQLKDPLKRNNRRLIVSAWNPCQIKEMALPPCHVMFQFKVTDENKLSCLMTQRSADVGLGLPYNIASYAFLTHLIAFHCDLEPKELIISLGSAHIYEQHIPQLSEQINREILLSPTLTIIAKEDPIECYTERMFEIHNYNSHPPISMEFIA